MRVDKDAAVYRDARARLVTLGLLGETAIDITQGNESSGRAPMERFSPASACRISAKRSPGCSTSSSRSRRRRPSTLKELQTTAQNLSKITEENSQLSMALAQMRTFAENLTSMTASDSPLQLALKNVENVSGNLNKITTDISANDNISVTLQNFRESSEKLKSAMNELAPDLRRPART